MDPTRPNQNTVLTFPGPWPSRRRVLRAAGVAVGLPLLEGLRTPTTRADGAERTRRRCLLAICDNLGVLPEYLFPTKEGADYDETPYLAHLREHRKDLTVLSGVSHPGVDGQHSSTVSFLTAAPHPGSGSFRNSISLDQLIAERIGGATRFASMTLAVNSRKKSISFTASGVGIPPEDRASEVFRQMYVQGSAEQVASQLRKLDSGQSVLDAIGAQARALERGLGNQDRATLAQYFTSVRELEQRLSASRAWETRPKPTPPGPMPKDPEDSSDYVEKVKLMYAMAKLAFETDSTRVITLLNNSLDTPVVDDGGGRNTEGYHNLSHHGKSEAKRALLRALDEIQMKLLADLLRQLRSVREPEGTLLDRTMVLWGSNLGDANAHTTTNMPILLAGGGFRHGRHLAFDRVRNYPLPNLFVSILERCGLAVDRFSSSTGPMVGLELA